MRISFRPKAVRDLTWFHDYYTRVFPEGGKGARLQIEALYNALLHYPQLGHSYEDDANLRQMRIAKTPFSLIYRTTADEIIVLRVLDGRSSRPTKVEIN